MAHPQRTHNLGRSSRHNHSPVRGVDDSIGKITVCPRRREIIRAPAPQHINMPIDQLPQNVNNDDADEGQLNQLPVGQENHHPRLNFLGWVRRAINDWVRYVGGVCNAIIIIIFVLSLINIAAFINAVIAEKEKRRQEEEDKKWSRDLIRVVVAIGLCLKCCLWLF